MIWEMNPFQERKLKRFRLWRLIYELDNSYSDWNYGGWRLVIMTPWFGLELAHAAKEMLNHSFSSRFSIWFGFKYPDSEGDVLFKSSIAWTGSRTYYMDTI